MTTDGKLSGQRKLRLQETVLDTAVSNFLASDHYYSCLLLIHPEIVRLKTAVTYLTETNQWPVFSVGYSLSEALLPIAPQQRSRQAARILPQLTKKYALGPLVCTDIDLLFEPSLSLDPFVLLRQISRQIKLIVTWPGTYQDNTLAYAVPEHGHYRTWYAPDLCEHCLFPL